MRSRSAQKSMREHNLEQAGVFDDIHKIKKLNGQYTFLFLISLITGFLLITPTHILIFGGVGLGERIDFIVEYFVSLFGGNPANWFGWISWYFGSVFRGMIGQTGENVIPAWRSGILLGIWSVFLIWPWITLAKKKKGLSNTPKIFGDTRWATEDDINAMSSKDLVGFDGNLFVVGKHKKGFIRMKETLSVLLLAPPGTGKTVAFIVPSTVMMDKSCQMINDQKPELFYMTSGHRATLGPVFQIMWSASDMPDGGWMSEEQAALINPTLLERDKNGNPVRDEGGAYKVKPIFFPSWNPLGPSSIPGAGPRRDLYIERLASVLCPDPSGSGDKFWTSKARAAMIGLVHYLVAKVEMGRDPDFPDITQDGIPEIWREYEASFPMLVDWFTEAQGAVEDSEGDDPMRELFKNAVNEARKMDRAYIAKTGNPVMGRAIAELTALMNSPDKTRGSILATLDEALGPFKNEAVRQRTKTSSFSFNELRGSPKPEARAREMAKKAEAKKRGEEYNPRYKRDEWEPITIFISINAEDARAFSTITGIFVDSANSYLVANGPNAIDDRGNQLGPNDFFFLLDETPTLPKLDTVMNGPAVGRSKRVSYAIVGQDFAQIETRYSKAEVETLKSTTAIKVILSQNNETAARAISQMAGKMTYLKENYGFEKEKGQMSFGKKEVVTGESWEGRDFIDISFVMAMPQDKHLVMVQNFMNRPILADTPKFFLVPEVLKRVYNLRNGQGPKPALPMPPHMIEDAIQRTQKEKKAKKKIQDVQAALEEPIVAIVVTPQNISDVSRDLSKHGEVVNALPVEDTFALCLIKITKDMEFFDRPLDSNIISTNDPETLKKHISGRKVYVFDDEDKETVSAFCGEEAPHESLFKVIKPFALEIDLEKEGDIFTVGYNGETALDPIHNPKDVTPTFALKWFAEIVALTHSVEYEIARLNANKAA